MKHETTRFVPARRQALAFFVVATSAGLAACTTTSGSSEGELSSMAKRRELDASVDATLAKLYESVPDSRELVQRASGVLVFPSVVRVSFGIGGAHGNGELRARGRTLGYYSVTSGSIGLQAGAQSRAVVYLFMTPDVLEKFRASNGWTAGVDATVAVANVGASGRVDTASAQQPVIAFVMTNAGLAAGVSLEGTKVTPIEI
ncbi:MAG: YSC84-related protein [Aquamicrobium sp.]|uniref:BPSL1445 family SYLF domain-containing lipoprotein n=1 Tax=Aquamicrobium sp. TaxID=1872579 RepID=UPI00349EC40C|nr:YSC84-related protein [Aquamicrobium sp.]